ncbi:hypothetical protein [Ruegeria jejuensis]|uniref:hypothetical protein n=1 Tax=Ruegeria jejuensis TaxID=3233338 RepID=UPI00355AD6AF
MAEQKPSRKRQKPDASREDRLKSALKANLARRKAQARKRADGQDKNEQAEG